MALIDISRIFQNLPPPENSQFIFNYTVCYNSSVGILKTMKKRNSYCRGFFFLSNFTDFAFLQLIPIEIDPVNSGVFGETAGENKKRS